MPRRKTHTENRRTWPRVAVNPTLLDTLAILLANRRLPLSEAHTLIAEALQSAYPDEYAAALAMIAKFTPPDEPQE